MRHHQFQLAHTHTPTRTQAMNPNWNQNQNQKQNQAENSRGPSKSPVYCVCASVKSDATSQPPPYPPPHLWPNHVLVSNVQLKTISDCALADYSTTAMWSHAPGSNLEPSSTCLPVGKFHFYPPASNESRRTRSMATSSRV